MSAPITVHGRLTRDPELKFANSGMALANLSIAVNERVKNKATGTYEDGEPSFFNAIAFGQMAEEVTESLAKGDLVLASGIMKMRKWEDKEGNPRTTFEITLDDIGKSLKWKTKDESRQQPKTGAEYDSPPF